MVIGYLRVSTGKQNLANQQNEIRRFADSKDFVIDSWVTEVVSGRKRERDRKLGTLLKRMKPGDTLIVAKLDRIARSAKNGLELIDQFIDKGVSVNILNMGVMNNSPTGKVIRTVMLAFAEFERDMIVERTREGKKIASQRPDYREGRKPTEYDRNLFDVLHEQVEKRILTVTDAAKQLGVTRQTWYRIAEQRKAG